MRVVIGVVQVGAVKMYVAVEVRRKNRREDETQFSVNMPATKHHPVIERRQSMVALILKALYCNIMIGCPVVTKMSSSFFYVWTITA